MTQRFLMGIGILNFLAVSVLSVLFFKNTQDVVYVDSTRLLANYKGMIDARTAYQEKASAWKANVDTLTVGVQRHIMKYEKESSKMSAKERQLSQELIQAKQKQLYDYQQAINAQAQQEDSKMTSSVVTQVNTYIKKYGESNGYQVILAATEYGNLAFADERLDITDQILDGLNKEYEGR